MAARIILYTFSTLEFMLILAEGEYRAELEVPWEGVLGAVFFLGEGVTAGLALDGFGERGTTNSFFSFLGESRLSFSRKAADPGLLPGLLASGPPLIRSFEGLFGATNRSFSILASSPREDKLLLGL